MDICWIDFLYANWKDSFVQPNYVLSNNEEGKYSSNFPMVLVLDGTAGNWFILQVINVMMKSVMMSTVFLLMQAEVTKRILQIEKM